MGKITPYFYAHKTRPRAAGTNPNENYPHDHIVNWVSQIPPNVPEGLIYIPGYTTVGLVEPSLKRGGDVDPISVSTSTNTVDSNLIFAFTAQIDSVIDLPNIESAITTAPLSASIDSVSTVTVNANPLTANAVPASIDSVTTTTVTAGFTAEAIPQSIDSVTNIPDVNSTVSALSAQIDVVTNTPLVTAEKTQQADVDSIFSSSFVFNVQSELTTEAGVDNIGSITNVPNLTATFRVQVNPNTIASSTNIPIVGSVLDEIFYPNNITGLIGWWDSREKSTIWNTLGDTNPTTGAFKAARWDDLVSGISVSAPTGAVEPTWSDLGFQSINGYPAMNFNGIDEYMVAASGALPASFDNRTEMTVCFVGDVSNNSGSFFQTTFAGGTSSKRAYRFFGSDVGAIYDGSIWRGSGGNSISSEPNWTIVTFDVSGSNMTITAYNDTGSAALTYSGAWAAGNADLVSFGVQYNYPSYIRQNYMAGQIGEILVYNKVLSAVERDEMQRYFEHFWDL